MNTDQEPPSTAQSARRGQRHGESIFFFSPIIDNIIKKNKLYNNTFSFICWGIISIVLLLKKRKKKGKPHNICIWMCIYIYVEKGGVLCTQSWRSSGK